MGQASLAGQTLREIEKRALIDTLEAAIEKLVSTERLVLDAAKKRNFDFETFERVWDQFERSRT